MYDDLKVTRYRANTGRQSSLKGSFNVLFERTGIEMNDFKVFQKDGRRWFALPSRPYEDKETGETKYANIMYISDELKYKAFQEGLRKAFDAFCAESAVPPPPQPEPEPRAAETFNHEEELPF